MRRTSVLIAGGGPAGLTAALALARGGASPLLFERHRTTPDHLCGGFLSWQTLDTLAEIGLDPKALGGHTIRHVTLFCGKQEQSAALPESGMGLSRRRLDGLLLAIAEKAGADIRRGTAINRAEGPEHIRLADGEEWAADALFLATGKFELRGLKRPVEEEDPDPWMGLRYRIAASQNLKNAIRETIELHIFRHGYAGLLLQEDGSANLCLALRDSVLKAADGDPQRCLMRLCEQTPSLSWRLAGETLPDTVDAVSRVPYGWRATEGRRGLFRIGDQGAVIPSLAGEGLGIAIASGRAAAQAYLEDGPEAAIQFQENLAKRARRPIAVASALKRLTDHPRLAGQAIRFSRLPGLMRLLGEVTRIRA